MNIMKDEKYTSPIIKVMTIEVEQAILTSTNEQIGDRLEDQDW